MSEKDEVFNVLADSATGEGEAAISRIEGEISAAIAGMIGFAFKDHLGNVVLPQLTTDGKLPVSSDAAGVHSENQGTVEAVVNVRTLVTTAALIPTKKYGLKFLSCASTQTVVWEVQQTNDASDNVRHVLITGAGDFTEQVNAGCLEFTAGASGTQEVRIYGTQIKGSASNMHGTLCLLQIGA